MSQRSARVLAAVRNALPLSGGQSPLNVPVEGADELPPGGRYRLASEYLLKESRLKRRETTVDAVITAVGTRTIEVDCTLPRRGRRERTWYIPVAVFPKDNVAPCLSVTDASGATLAIPTKQENMALTKAAIAELIASGRLNFGDSEEVHDLVEEIVTREAAEARVCRLVFEQNRPPEAAKILPLLVLLEGRFLLWVPIDGAPGTQHHVSLARREIRGGEPLIARRPVTVVRTIETALGFVQFEAREGVGRRMLRAGVALDRLLRAFALRPIEAAFRDVEAARSSSVHLRFDAPEGFSVRNIRAAEFTPAAYRARPRLREITSEDEGVVVQGHDQDLGHIHLSMAENPRRLYCRMTLGLRGDVTTLWMLATVLSAALLWVVHHHSSYGPHSAHEPKFAVPAAFFALLGSAPKHLAIGANNRQIAAAVLLVGPAFASAWALRSEAGEVLRLALAGSRLLLLSSAALSVAAALALADIVPTESGRYNAIEFYASASYFVAVPMIGTWLLSSRWTWVCFRSALHSENRNLLAVFGLGILALLLGLPLVEPGRIVGAILFFIALALLAISANSVAEPLSGPASRHRPLAGVGSIPLFIAAGSLLGFYADLLHLQPSRWMAVISGALICLLALYLTWRKPNT